jgi:UDP-glucose 4-epimerase
VADLSPTRVLVTGGAGFIGSHLVDALLAGAHRVAILDDLSGGGLGRVAAPLARGAELHVEDVRDGEAVARVLTAVRPSVVFHLAAQTSVCASVADPVLDARANGEGTLHVLEAARRARVGRVVFTSTGGAIYGEPRQVPTPESAPPRPLSPYGQSKAAAEGYLALYGRLHGLSTVSLRLANVYGPGQEARAGGAVVALFAERLRAGLPLEVHGDGGQTRDWVFVGDVVDALLAAAASPARGPVNVGSGRETSVLALARQLCALGGGEGEIVFGAARQGEPRRSCLAVRRAAGLLGWRARTPLARGLRLAWEAALAPA